MNHEELKSWFKQRHVWLQQAAERIIEKGTLDEEDCSKFLACCLSEAENEAGLAGASPPIEKLLNNQTFGSAIKLKEIRGVEGVNMLSPRKPLKFGEGNLSVVFGSNGSGKSGYARILKHVCGAKSRAPLLSNIFRERETEKKCKIVYQKGDDKIEELYVFKKPIDDLRQAHVFDSECGKIYVEDKNEVIYEPRILLFFSALVKVCDAVSSKIKEEIDKNISQKPAFPLKYKGAKEADWYEKLSAETSEKELEIHCQWTAEDESELSSLQTRLAQRDPAKEAEKIRKQNARVKEIIDESKKFLAAFSEEKYKEINDLKERHVQAKKTAKAAADKVFSSSSLKGVGAETWQQLWEHARKYSEKEAYKGRPFPVTDDALCVLCHQPLDPSAKERLKSFEEFVKGAVQKAESAAKESLERSIREFPEVPKEENLKDKIAAAELKESEEEELKSLYDKLRKRQSQFQNILTDSSPSLMPPLPDIREWEKKLESLIKDNEEKAKQYDEDAREASRESARAKQKSLNAKEWLSQQRDSVKKEIERLKWIKLLKKAKSLADTTSLSRKKSKLSEKLITEDFITRFNNELKKLKAGEIKVEIVKSGAKKGKALHAIRLKGAASNRKANTWEILSEGENRIVALSAFLADVTGEKLSAPFIFDDPISSLDQKFEEAVARRLVELSEKRQVIVFTHRLSMLGLLEEYSKKQKIEPHITHVRKESWGAGEPGDTPLFVKKPEKALNSLIERLPQAREILKTEDQSKYNGTATGLCADFRIVIERAIEKILLADIVKRHRRQVHTQKVENLSKIKPEDCRLIDKLMTKYSRVLHSQSDESSCEMPKPDELERDFKELKKWMEDFAKRPLS